MVLNVCVQDSSAFGCHVIDFCCSVISYMEMENRGRNEKGERERLVVIRERKEREAI